MPPVSQPFSSGPGSTIGCLEESRTFDLAYRFLSCCGSKIKGSRGDSKSVMAIWRDDYRLSSGGWQCCDSASNPRILGLRPLVYQEVEHAEASSVVYVAAIRDRTRSVCQTERVRTGKIGWQ